MTLKPLAQAMTAILALAAMNSLAADRGDRMTLSMMSGMQQFDNKQDFESSLPLQLTLGYLYNRNFSVELLGNFNDSKIDSSPTHVASLAAGAGTKVDTSLVGLNALYHFDKGASQQLVPYLVAGLGKYAVRYRNPAQDTRTSDTAFNLGGGFNYYFNDNYAWRSDLRYLQVDDTAETSNLLFTTGLHVAFDSIKKPMDSDGDGVVDGTDKCPNTPVGAAVDASGCPLDSDHDGVADYQDKCSATPRGAKVDATGCEIAAVKPAAPKDSDSDGVTDDKDKCPNTEKGAVVDSTGCKVLKEEKVSLELAVQFPTNKATIDKKYHGKLQEAADFLKSYSVTAVIEGHTDSTGKPATNKTLSQKRADAIRDYLISQFGVDATQVTAKGFGSEKPIASNANAAGRAQNRRVMMNMTAVKRK